MGAVVQGWFDTAFGTHSAEARAWLRGAALDWLFVAKATFAVLLTGWLAMALDLEQPGTAMMTVAIVIHPQSGMVIAKSFYRALGTLIGCAAAFAIVGTFPQQRVPFLLCMALWLGLCAGGASLQRNFRSYGFVLAGYTAAIVALPVVNHPQNVFNSAVMRVSEVMLGIFVAAIVSDAIFPQRLGDVLRESVRGQFADFIVFVRDSLRGALPRPELEKAHLRFVRAVVQIEAQRSSVVFEDVGVRLRSPRLRRFNHAFMAASTSYQSLHHLLNRLQADEQSPVRERLMALAGSLADALGPAGSEPRTAAQAPALSLRLAASAEHLPARAQVLRDGLQARSDRLDFDTGAELIQRIATELHEYSDAYARLALRNSAVSVAEAESNFAHANDWAGAAVVVARTTLTMLVMGTFWLASAWTDGAGAMLIATIFSGLMATLADPLRAIGYMLVGYFVGIVCGIVCLYGVLIHMDGFVLFSAALVPFLLPGFYLSARPAWPGVGAGYLLALLYTVAAKNTMGYDALHSINDSLSQLLGVVCAGAAFMLFAGASDSPWLLGRLLRKLRLQVVHACAWPLRGLLPRFESASRDVAAQIVAHTRPGSAPSREGLAWSLAVQETGRALIELRSALSRAEVPMPLRERIGAAMAALAALYAEPGREKYWQARELFSVSIDEAVAYPALMSPLHLIRLALLDADSVLGAYLRPSAQEHDHAA